LFANKVVAAFNALAAVNRSLFVLRALSSGSFFEGEDAAEDAADDAAEA
jgi:hypothetical protein